MSVGGRLANYRPLSEVDRSQAVGAYSNRSGNMTTKPGVFVLGGTGEIGSNIALKFQANGHQVLTCGTNDFDLSSSQSIKDWLDRPRLEVGVLIHSAGFNDPKLFIDSTDEDIRQSLEVNLEGFLKVTRILLPELIRCRGRIVVISSIFGFLSRSGRLPYSASKHALLGACKTLAIELGGVGVLVNSVSPGYIETELTHKNNDHETISRLVRNIPVQRLGLPSDVAEATYFLGSESNQYITGQNIIVDGGLSIDGGRN
ncbi:MAG: SDR family oxidoreductase [Acidimicrobiales bacterium]